MSDAGCSLESGILFCYFPWKRWAKAETKGSADAEVLEEFNQELDKKDRSHRQVISADDHVFDDKWRKSLWQNTFSVANAAKSLSIMTVTSGPRSLFTYDI